MNHTKQSLKMRHLTAQWTFAVCLVAMLVSSTHAATATEALRGINQVGASCRIEDMKKEGAVWTGPQLAADARCAITVERVAQLQSHPHTLIVDLRPKEAFSLAHIDGAINATSAELHTKPYWKSRRVVLVGSGKGEHQLLQLCGSLKQAGYSEVHVLNGGMLAWARDRQPESGRAHDADGRQLIDAAELFVEAQDPATLLLLPPAFADLSKEFVGTTLTTSNLGVEQLEAMVRKVVAGPATPNRPAPLRVVLVAPATVTPAELGELARRLRPLPVLVYRSSVEELREFLRGHKAGLVALARGPRRPGCGL